MAGGFVTLKVVLLHPRRLTLALAFASLVTVGCGARDDETLAGRLWVDHLPTDARDEVVSLMIVDVKGRSVGVGHRGTAFRGSYFSFRWEQHESVGTMTMLQDGREVRVAIESCTPDDSFDYCVEIHGDPSGATRYQSRKRWGIRSAGSASSAASIWSLAMGQLAMEDEALGVMVASDGDDLGSIERLR